MTEQNKSAQNKTWNLNLPLQDNDIEQLGIGDAVYLSGVMYTARDMAHLQIANLRKNCQPLPADFSGAAVFHAGPVAKKNNDGWEISVIGPTTSIRMEPYADMMGELGVKLILGKGGMAQGSSKAFQTYKQAYLQGPPGCAAVLASAVKKVKDVYWPELGMPESVWVLEVEKFGPFIVTMDCRGNSLYQTLKDEAYQKLEGLLQA